MLRGKAEALSISCLVGVGQAGGMAGVTSSAKQGVCQSSWMLAVDNCGLAVFDCPWWVRNGGRWGTACAAQGLVQSVYFGRWAKLRAVYMLVLQLSLHPIIDPLLSAQKYLQTDDICLQLGLCPAKRAGLTTKNERDLRSRGVLRTRRAIQLESRARRQLKERSL